MNTLFWGLSRPRRGPRGGRRASRGGKKERSGRGALCWPIDPGIAAGLGRSGRGGRQKSIGLGAINASDSPSARGRFSPGRFGFHSEAGLRHVTRFRLCGEESRNMLQLDEFFSLIFGCEGLPWRIWASFAHSPEIKTASPIVSLSIKEEGSSYHHIHPMRHSIMLSKRARTLQNKN